MGIILLVFDGLSFSDLAKVLLYTEQFLSSLGRQENTTNVVGNGVYLYSVQLNLISSKR